MKTTIYSRGFSLLEVMISIAIFGVILITMSTIVNSVSDIWKTGKGRIETYQSARGAIEILARELTPAVVDTRMQFVVLPAEELQDRGASHVVPNTSAILWMAPVGEQGALRCLGYYLSRDESRNFHRLKRIYITPENEKYFPRMLNAGNPNDALSRTSAVNAEWFLRSWDEKAFNEEDLDNDTVIVSTVADNIIALWIQCIDLLGNPIPWLEHAPNHPKSSLIYNSAGYFQMATTTPFENGKSLVFLSQTSQTMKANRVPSAIDITVATIDSDAGKIGLKVPPIENVFADDGTLDVAESIRRFNKALLAEKIKKSRIFSTRVKLLNGS